MTSRYANLNIVFLALFIVGSNTAHTAPLIGNGEVINEQRPGTGITAVRAKGVPDYLIGDCNLLTVKVSPMNEPAILLEAESNLLPYIRTEVQNETLIISVIEKIQPNTQITITAPRLGAPPSTIKSTTPPYFMRGIGCSQDFTMQLQSSKKRSVVEAVIGDK